MILLKAVPRPAQLTDEVVRQLTEQFKSDKSQRVWNQSYIKESLLIMSHGKCCYCECKVVEESKYVEVEHYLPKDPYEDEVVNWENLLPACKRCNGNKSNHDTKAEPIVHPVRIDPRVALILKGYRFYPNSEIGKTTIRVLDLNDRIRLVNKRFEVGSKVIETLDDLEEQLERVRPRPRDAAKIQRKLRAVMLEGQPTSSYSAVVATAILTEDAYHNIKQTLSDFDLWDVDMQQLETELYNIAYLPSLA